MAKTVKPLSEHLADLSVRAKKAEDDAAAAKSQAESDIQRRQDEIRANAEQRKATAKQHLAEAEASVSSAWDGMTDKVQSDVEGLRTRIDFKKYQHDAKRAAQAADAAEDNAVYAISFALDAIDNADIAVLDAIMARETADSYVS